MVRELRTIRIEAIILTGDHRQTVEVDFQLNEQG